MSVLLAAFRHDTPVIGSLTGLTNTASVLVKGAKGYPPPPTTKLALFYKDGFQSEFTINATAYATREKYDLQEAQIKHELKARGILDKFQLLDFQR